jgi:hypothetical protein
MPDQQPRALETLAKVSRLFRLVPVPVPVPLLVNIA